MRRINLGAIKINWKGEYNASSTYQKNDAISYMGSSYICKISEQINPSNGNIPTITATPPTVDRTTDNNWDLMAGAAKQLTTQGDILYHDGSNITRLSAGIAGQILTTHGPGQNPSWDFHLGRVKYSVKDINSSIIQGGSFFNCVVMADDTLRTWGKGDHHQLGLGPMTTSFTQMAMNPYFDKTDLTVTQLKTVKRTVYCIMSDKTVYAWGDNTSGHLGHSHVRDVQTPTPIPGATNIKKMAVTPQTILLLDDNGKIYSCGSNSHGQLGNGTNLSEKTLIELAKKDWKDIFIVGNILDDYISCFAIDNAGHLYGWGVNQDGMLGIGHKRTEKAPHRINLEDTVTSFSSNLGIGSEPIALKNFGGSSGCVLKNGKVYTWGYNGYGQLGVDMKNYEYLIPNNISSLGTDNEEIYMFGELYGTTIVKKRNNNGLYMFGSGANGRLGINGTSSTHTPQLTISPAEIKSRSGIKQIVPSGFTRLGMQKAWVAVLFNNGTILAWGDNTYGNLGVGLVEHEILVPKEVKINHHKPEKIGISGYKAQASLCYLTQEGYFYVCGAPQYHMLKATDNALAYIPIRQQI